MIEHTDKEDDNMNSKIKEDITISILTKTRKIDIEAKVYITPHDKNSTIMEFDYFASLNIIIDPDSDILKRRFVNILDLNNRNYYRLEYTIEQYIDKVYNNR